MRILGFMALLTVLQAVPALASDPGAKPAAADQSVKLSPVALPIVVGGRLVNYVFATVQVDLSGWANVAALSEKEPMFRDALVRDAHRTPFVLANDYNHLDVAKLKSVFMRDAVAIAGPGAVKGVDVLEQTPQHNVRVPHAAPLPSAPSSPAPDGLSQKFDDNG